MVPSPLHKTLTQDKKEMLRHKRPLPYSTPKTKNPRQNISQDQERSNAPRAPSIPSKKCCVYK